MVVVREERIVKRMRLKIVSSPGRRGNDTMVIDADTGEMVQNVISVDLHIGTDGTWGTIRIAGPELDIYDLQVEAK